MLTRKFILEFSLSLLIGWTFIFVFLPTHRDSPPKHHFYPKMKGEILFANLTTGDIYPTTLNKLLDNNWGLKKEDLLFMYIDEDRKLMFFSVNGFKITLPNGESFTAHLVTGPAGKGLIDWLGENPETNKTYGFIRFSRTLILNLNHENYKSIDWNSYHRYINVVDDFHIISQAPGLSQELYSTGEISMKLEIIENSISGLRELRQIAKKQGDWNSYLERLKCYQECFNHRLFDRDCIEC